MLRKIFLILVIVSVCNSLHLQTTERYNATNYYGELNKVQQDFTADINNIKLQIQQMDQNIKNSLTSTQKLVILNEGMADQRQALYNIQKYLYKPFQIQPCSQTNMTKQEQNNMKQKINNVSNSLNLLQSKVQSTQQSGQKKQFLNQIKLQYNYLQVINQTLYSKCLKKPFVLSQQKSMFADITKSIYKDNLKGSNWQYGNITQQEYKMQTFYRSTQYNLTSCPQKYPYVDKQQKKCISCRGIFNIGTRQCKQCPVGSIYDSNVKPSCVCNQGSILNEQQTECVSICNQQQFYNINTKACEKKPNQKDCAYGQIWDQNKGCVNLGNTASMCPPTKPYWNSTLLKCTQCPKSTSYNLLVGKCQPCKSGQYFNQQSGKCQIQIHKVCQIGFNYDSNTGKCKKCIQGTYFSQSTGKCIKCQQNTNFNIETQKCQKLICSKGQYLNSQNKCIKATYMTSPKAANLIYGYSISQYQEQFNKALQANQQLKQCPEQTPYFSKKKNQCVKCPETHPYFNLHTSLCQNCGDGQYDKQALKCKGNGANLNPTLQRLIMNIV